MNSSQIKNRQFVERQLLHLMSENHSLTSAIEALLAFNQPLLKIELMELKRLFKQNNSWLSSFSLWLPGSSIALILQRNLDTRISDTRWIKLFNRFNHQLTTTITNIKSRLMFTLSYLTVLMLVAVITFSTLSIYVLSTFQEIFHSFRAVLPELTTFFIEHQNVVLGLNFLLFCYVFISIIAIKRTTLDFHKKTNWHRWLPLVGFILTESMSFRHRMITLLTSQEPTQPTNTFDSSILISKQLGNLDNEFDILMSERLALLQHQMDLRTRLLTLVFQIVVVSSICLALLAFYLPIFSLGTIV